MNVSYPKLCGWILQIRLCITAYYKLTIIYWISNTLQNYDNVILLQIGDAYHFQFFPTKCLLMQQRPTFCLVIYEFKLEAAERKTERTSVEVE